MIGNTTKDAEFGMVKWFRIGFLGKFLWTRYWTSHFHKSRVISWRPRWLSTLSRISVIHIVNETACAAQFYSFVHINTRRLMKAHRGSLWKLLDNCICFTMARVMLATFQYNHHSSDIIHRPVFYLKHKVSDTGVCLRVQVKPTQFGPMHRASLCLRTPAE
jgi:hypothetical protein